MNRDQKSRLAEIFISQIGNLFEDDRLADFALEGVTLDEMREQIAKWIPRLPGNVWDVRLSVEPRDGD